MGYQSAYAKTLLGIDVAKESMREQRELEEAIEEREKEEGIKAIAGVVGSVVGSAFGPIGQFAGKTIATLGTDFLMDSEASGVAGGKFNKAETDAWNKSLDKYDKEGNIANALNVVKDAGMSFLKAGGVEGLKDTLERGDSVMDFATSFGAGEDAKMSLYKWMNMSGAEKAQSGLTDISYFEYLLGMSGEPDAAGKAIKGEVWV